MSDLEQTIRESWDRGVAALRPSAADLEHGLELHRSALVCDAFFLGACAAVDGPVLQTAMDAGAGGDYVRGLMQSMQIRRWASDVPQRDELRQILHAAGLTFVFQNAEATETGARQASHIAYWREVIDGLPEYLRLGRSADGIRAAKAARGHAIGLSLNHVPLENRLGSVEEELGLIKVFAALGVRMMHLTYDRRNRLADGCREPADGGLSDFGRQALAEMNRGGVLVDVAHAGWRSSREAAEASVRPVVASHTTCAGLHRHPRGKPDEVIAAIADTGGYIGITCVPAFLGGAGDITALLDHVDYAVQRFGAEHVAIGTDVLFIPPRAAQEARRFTPPSRVYRDAPVFEAIAIPPDPPETPAQIATMALTNWPLFTVGLVQRGHRDDAIQQIIGGNVLRVLGDRP